MSPKASVRFAIAVAATSTSALFLVQCTQEPGKLPDPSSSGGSPSGRGGATDDAGLGGRAGSGGAPWVVKLDADPSLFGEKDAPQEPDLPAAPTIDANCGMSNNETVRQPVDVLLLLDRSTSMYSSISDDCYCSASRGVGAQVCPLDAGTCTERWEAIKTAVKATLASSSFVNWGMKMFASGTGGACVVNDTIEVPLGADTAEAIQSQIDTATLSSSTPTAAGLKAATKYLSSLTDDPNKKVILLATDGEPNCGGTPASVMTNDVKGAVAAATAAKEAGFPVYVIGIGPSIANLSSLAEAGGTTNYYPATSAEQLAQALTSISKMVGSCTFTSEKAPPDRDNVAVYVNKQQINKSDSEGWRYGDSDRDIVLTGSFCERITAGNDTKVQILFGCPGDPPFPPIVP